MKAELFREINGRFLLKKIGDPTFLVHLVKENTTLDDISKFEEFFIVQFSNIPINSLLQSDLRCFTGSVQTNNLPIISLLSFLRQVLKGYWNPKMILGVPPYFSEIIKQPYF